MIGFGCYEQLWLPMTKRETYYVISVPSCTCSLKNIVLLRLYLTIQFPFFFFLCHVFRRLMFQVVQVLVVGEILFDTLIRYDSVNFFFLSGAFQD